MVLAGRLVGATLLLLATNPVAIPSSSLLVSDAIQHGGAASDASSTPCTLALAAACPGNVRTSAGVMRCDACAGSNQARLRTAGCSAAAVQAWCSTRIADTAGNMSFMSIMASKSLLPPRPPMCAHANIGRNCALRHCPRIDLLMVAAFAQLVTTFPRATATLRITSYSWAGSPTSRSWRVPVSVSAA